MSTYTSRKTYRLVISALLLAVGFVLPFITGNIQAIAKVISPLHIPALICGLCCGPAWGAVLGAVMPVLRGLIVGIPVFPTSALPMAFELAAYGFFTGVFYQALLKKRLWKSHLPAMMISLVCAMILGRFVGGAAKALMLAVGVIGSKSPYTFAAFFTSYFVSTAVGALIHLILVPAVVLALEKAKLSPMTGDLR